MKYRVHYKPDELSGVCVGSKGWEIFETDDLVQATERAGRRGYVERISDGAQYYVNEGIWVSKEGKELE